ncbi:MAG: Mut7-C ubiquitin/RNAse domain-containing protein [Spirochaetes bacterium]|nr:Mut7-C ubiquitin/RNAse domain-containing protein [Spirochaetota bacterium]
MSSELASRGGTYTAEVSYRIAIRFYEELNDFLPEKWRKREFELCFSGKRSVKDLIESIGVPHVEVDLILVNGESVGFDYIVQDGDRISVYPMFEMLDISQVTKLRPHPLREIRFVLDVHLRKLARYLRLFGFDVLFDETLDDAKLAEISSRQRRVLLTRDRGLLKRRIVERGFVIRNTDPRQQLLEVFKRLNLWSLCNPFSRCLECNGAIIPANDVPDEHAIPLGVRQWCNEYFRCVQCGKVYWKGSHYEKLARFVNRIMNEGNFFKNGKE